MQSRQGTPGKSRLSWRQDMTAPGKSKPVEPEPRQVAFPVSGPRLWRSPAAARPNRVRRKDLNDGSKHSSRCGWASPQPRSAVMAHQRCATSDAPVSPGLQECAFLQLLEGLAELFLRIHHDRAIPGHRLLERL